MGGIKGGRETRGGREREGVCTELRPLMRREGGREGGFKYTPGLMFQKTLKLGCTNRINHTVLEASFISQMKSELDLGDLWPCSAGPVQPKPSTCSQLAEQRNKPYV